MSITNLSLEERPLPGGIVIAARGEIDRSTAAGLSDALRRATIVAESTVTLDLCEVTFMDSSGISVLLNAVRRLTRRDLRLRLVCARGELLRVLQLAGLTEKLDVRTAAGTVLATRS